VSKPVYVAAEFGSRMTTLAGAADAIVAAQAVLDSWGVRYANIPTAFAIHCPILDVHKEDFVQRLQGLTPRRPTLPVYSSITGGRLENAAFDALHFWNAVRAPALYGGAMRQIINDGYDTFLEVALTSRLYGSACDFAQDLGKSVNVFSSLECLSEGKMPAAQPVSSPTPVGKRPPLSVWGLRLPWQNRLRSGPDRAGSL
jgi:myxalamid-type polyketide synthase MxaE and MxaD